MEHRYNYEWTFKETTFTKDKGKVFSTFSCGGGSTMGYKLAGFDVIGNLEIDKRKNETYVKNHHPRFNYCEDIRKFRLRKDLPKELYNLDILDGSPPCLTFSVAGEREEKWGETFYHDGITQRWDDLYFEFIALANTLRPKVVIAENVKGMLLGEAIDYARRIRDGFEEAGYTYQHFLLNSAYMGVPQARERVFFVCLRKDLEDWKRLKDGEEKKYFQSALVPWDKVHPTIVEGYSSKASPMPEWEARWLSDADLCKVGSFPLDYDFNGIKAHKLIGRSVPPVMMAQISSRVYDFWLSKL